MDKLLINNSFALVDSGNRMIHQAIWDALSYKNPSAYIIKQKTNRHSWDGMSSLYSKREMIVLTGLIPRVTKFLSSQGIELEIEDTRKDPVSNYGSFAIDGLDYYPYQERAIQDFLKAKRGVINAATASGKTIMAKGIVKALNIPTLFLTHRSNLMYQSAKRFENRLKEYRGKIGIIGDGQYEPNFITFATVQTLASMVKNSNEKAKELLEQFQFVIVDECHRMKAKTFIDVLNCCTNAYYRCGLSGTVFSRNDPVEDMRLIGGIGEICSKVTSTELIKEGIIAQPYVKYFKVDQPRNIWHLKNYDEIYDQGIVKNEYRNELVVETTIKALEKRKRLLIVTLAINHGKLLTTMLKAKGLKVDFVSGVDSTSTRDRILKRLASDKLDAVVTSTIMDEGINVPNIEGIILAGGGKSIPGLLQRIGRAIRKKDENWCLIIDFYDDIHPILRKHSQQRIKTIKDEPGFILIPMEN